MGRGFERRCFDRRAPGCSWPIDPWRSCVAAMLVRDSTRRCLSGPLREGENSSYSPNCAVLLGQAGRTPADRHHRCESQRELAATSFQGSSSSVMSHAVLARAEQELHGACTNPFFSGPVGAGARTVLSGAPRVRPSARRGETRGMGFAPLPSNALRLSRGRSPASSPKMRSAPARDTRARVSTCGSRRADHDVQRSRRRSAT